MRIPENKIRYYVDKYRADKAGQFDQIFEDEIKSTLTERRYITRDELLKIAKWKAARSVGHCKRNSEEEVHELSQISFSASTERAYRNTSCA